MKIEVGKKLKLEHHGITKGGVVGKTDDARIGTVAEVKEHYIIIQFKNYKESVLKVDVIAPIDWILYVREGKTWVQATKEMLK